jgi:hypothetical protein
LKSSESLPVIITYFLSEFLTSSPFLTDEWKLNADELALVFWLKSEDWKAFGLS